LVYLYLYFLSSMTDPNFSYSGCATRFMVGHGPEGKFAWSYGFLSLSLSVWLLVEFGWRWYTCGLWRYRCTVQTTQNSQSKRGVAAVLVVADTMAKSTFIASPSPTHTELKQQMYCTIQKQRLSAAVLVTETTARLTFVAFPLSLQYQKYNSK